MTQDWVSFEHLIDVGYEIILLSLYLEAGRQIKIHRLHLAYMAWINVSLASHSAVSSPNTDATGCDVGQVYR